MTLRAPTLEQSIIVNVTGKDEISRLSSQLKTAQEEFDRITATLQNTESELERVTEEFEQLQRGTGVDILKEKLESFQETARQSVREFRVFLESVNLNDRWGNNDDAFKHLFDQIREGSITAFQAITDVKTNFRELMEENYNNSGGLFDSQAVQSFTATLDRLSESMDVVVSKLNTMEREGVRTIGEVGSGSGIANITEIIQQIEAATSGMTEGARAAYEPITNLVRSMTEYANLDETRILGVSQAFRNIANIGTGSYGTKSIDNILRLARELQALSAGGMNSIRFDFTGLEGIQNLKVGKASLRNMAEFLPTIASVDMSNLERLAAINWANLGGLNIGRINIGDLTQVIDAINKLHTGEQTASPARTAELGNEKAQVQVLNQEYSEHKAVVQEAAQAEAQKAAESGEVAAAVGTEKGAMEGATNAAREHAEALGEMGDKIDTSESTKRATDSMKQYTKSSAEQMRLLQSSLGTYERGVKALSQWSAAEHSLHASSRDAYQNLKANVDALGQTRQRYQDGAASALELRQAQDALQTSLRETGMILRENGDATMSFGERISNLGKKFGAWFGTTRIIMGAIRAIKQMVSAVTELDSAFAQLRIVTGATDAEMEQFAQTAYRLSQAVGRNVVDVTKSIETFSRLGYALPDATELAQLANVLANVASVDVDEATTGMTSIIKGYDMNVQDASHVADVLVSVGQKYAVSASEMMEAYEKTGAALHATNTTFEKSAGLIAAANAAVQNSSVVGTALKTVSARIRGSKTDLEELGEDTEDLADGFSKYAAEIKALTGVNIMVEGSANEFKDLYDIMSEIASVWDSLTDTQQARTAEILGGTRQLQVIASILSNFGDAAGAYETAMNSAGEATKANAIYMETAQAHINQMKAAFQELAMNFIQSDFVAGVADIGRFLLEVLNGIVSVTNALGGLKAILIGIAATLSVIKADAIFMLIGKAFTTVSSFIGLFGKLAKGLTLFTAYQMTGAKATGMLNNMSTALNAVGISASSAQIAMAAFAAAVAAVILIINRVNSAYEEEKQKARELATEQKRIGDSASDTSDDISKLISEYNELDRKVNENTASKEDLLQKQDSIIDSLELEKAAVDKLAKGYGNYTDALRAAAAEKQKSQFVDMQAGITGAGSALVDAAQSQLSLIPVAGAGYMYAPNPVYMQVTLDKISPEDEKVIRAIQDISGVSANITYGSGGGGIFGFSVDSFTIDDLGDVESILTIYDRLRDTLEAIGETGVDLQNNDIYNTLLQQYLALQGPVEDYRARIAAFNDALANVQLQYALIGRDLPKTTDEFISFRQELIDSAVASKQFAGTSSDIEESIDRILRSQPNLVGFFADIAKNTINNDDAQKYALKIIENARARLKEYGDEYNKLVDGNVDYNKRPFVSGKKMIEAGWEDFNPGDTATTYSQGFTIGEGEAVYTISVTPILDNGLVLTPDNLKKYVETLDTSNGKQALLDSDKLGLVIHVVDGDYDKNYWNGLEGRLQAIKDKHLSLAQSISSAAMQAGMLISNLRSLPAEDFEIVEKLLKTGSYASWEELMDAASDYKNHLKSLAGIAEKTREKLTDLWDNEGFEDARKKIEEAANAVGGITADNINELVSSSEELASVLEIDGINAQFLAHILQTQVTSGNGFDLITEDALILNSALDGMTKRFGEVTAAKARYDKAMSVPEKDTEFRSMADAFTKLNEQFEAGTTNSNTFWAAAEYLFGTEQLNAWGWQDGIDNIYNAMKENVDIFKDADSAGYGFLQRLYDISEGGQVLNENGDWLADIEKLEDGSYKFDIDDMRLDELAEKMGMSEEAVLSCLKALSMFGDVDYYDMQEVLTAVKKIGLSTDDFDGTAVNVSALTEQLRNLGYTGPKLYDVLSDLQEMDGITLVDVNGDVESLVGSLEKLGIVKDIDGKININVGDVANLASKLDMTKDDATKILETLSGVENIQFTNATGQVTDLKGAVEELNSYDFKDTEQDLGNLEKKADKVKTSANNASVAFDALNNKRFPGVTGSMNNLNTSTQNVYRSVGNLNKALDRLNGKTVKITYDSSVTSGIPPLLATGTKRAPEGPALVGDEYSPDGRPKPELIASGDSAYLAGTHGAEIVHLNAGDTVYTADETRRILRGAKQIRGTIPAYKGGISGSVGNKTWESLLGDGSGKSGSGSGKSNSSSSKSGSSSASAKKEAEEAESWFDKLYKEHKHLLAMNEEDMADYLNWLVDAYQKAYGEGIIELDDYRKYREEVYDGLMSLFKDYLGDVEHEIDMRGNFDGETKKILALYQKLMKDVEKEVTAARASGLDDTDDYIQELQKKWTSYQKSLKDLQDDILENAKDAVDDLVDYRLKMIKQDADNEKDGLKKKLDNLKEFYDKQKKLLQDANEEEKYLEEQAEKRRDVASIKEELARLSYDDSGWAQRRRLELQQSLAEAEKALNDFERDHALDDMLDFLDDAYDKQEKEIDAQIDALDELLNDPEALYNRALQEIRENTDHLLEQMLEYNRRYGSGNDEDVIETYDEAYRALQEFHRLNDEWYKNIQLLNSTNAEFTGPWDDTPVAKPQATSTASSGDTSTQSTAKQTSSGSAALTEEIKKAVAAAIWQGNYGWGSGKDRTSRLTEVFGANNGIQALVNSGVGRNSPAPSKDYTYLNMRKKFRGYWGGTENAKRGLHEVDELGPEYTFVSSDGSRYRVFSGGEKVLNARATDFLYQFANGGKEILNKIVTGMMNSTVRKILPAVAGNQIQMGDINIRGNADASTVSEIRRAQREQVELMLKEFTRLSR